MEDRDETSLPKRVEHQPFETEGPVHSSGRGTVGVNLELADNPEVQDPGEAPVSPIHEGGGETAPDSLEEPVPGCSFWGMDREPEPLESTYSRLR